MPQTSTALASLVRSLPAACILLAAVGTAQAPEGPPPPSFNRDIRPILSNRCFACHGPDADARKGKLRLDTREGALAPRRSGAAIVPGDPDASLLIQRIHSDDPKKRMPPRSTGAALSAPERETLRRWIAGGAKWQRHWSFEPIPRPDGPRLGPDGIDRLLDARIAARGITPTGEADARTLIRRLHFDLVGLPPTSADLAADLTFEQRVDRLLASPHHAERLTVYWLDLVRYADSVGIHGDQPVSMSPYRDWVIQAFADNMPFDAFTRAQIAGDLLPDATRADRIASGYNRLNMKTAEGGAQPAEYLAKYAADRVRTTGNVWLGTTLGCAECHDHKFDPYTTEDFYRFAAFFADLDHKGLYAGANNSGDWGPKITVPNPDQERELAALDATIAELVRRSRRATPETRTAQKEWERRTTARLATAAPPVLTPWRSIGPFRAKSLRAAHDQPFPPEQDFDPTKNYGAKKWRSRPFWSDGVVHKLTGATCATYLCRDIDSEMAQSLRVSLGSDDSFKIWLNGELIRAEMHARGVRADQALLTLPLRKGKNQLLFKISNGSGGYGFYFDTRRSGPPADIVAILRKPEARRSHDDRLALTNHFLQIAPSLQGVRTELAAARERRKKLAGSLPTTLVSKARPKPRTTRILRRGNWQDQGGKIVEPATPAFLTNPAPADPGASRRLTRLDLARWLTHPDNPLTARVFVNRMWKLLFGKGLCPTVDDIGSQGAWPEHLDLLDALAADFRRDWNVRRLLRQIVLSKAYRRSSQPTPEHLRVDADNLLFARQARFRIDAEFIRDQALAVSALLDHRIGGPSVKPYQPAGHWAQLNFPKRTWKADGPDGQYRRGIYTHWQRTFLHPSLLAFDAPTREECTAERLRSNTPQQALSLLNDPSFVEAARVLAAQLLTEVPGPDRDADRIALAFDRVLQRGPTDAETQALQDLLASERPRYRADPAAARALTTVGIAPAAKDLSAPEHAAWTAVARVLLNLHETITRY